MRLICNLICSLSLIIPYNAYATSARASSFSEGQDVFFSLSAATVNSVKNTDGFLQLMTNVGLFNSQDVDAIRAFLNLKKVNMAANYPKVSIKNNTLLLNGVSFVKFGVQSSVNYIEYNGRRFLLKEKSNYVKIFKEIFIDITEKVDRSVVISFFIDNANAASTGANVKEALKDASIAMGAVATSLVVSLGIGLGTFGSGFSSADAKFVVVCGAIVGAILATGAAAGTGVYNFFEYSKVKCMGPDLVIGYDGLSFRIPIDKNKKATSELLVSKDGHPVKTVKVEDASILNAYSELYYKSCVLNEATKINSELKMTFEEMKKFSTTTIPAPSGTAVPGTH